MNLSRRPERCHGVAARTLGTFAVVIVAVFVAVPGSGGAATNLSLEHLGRPVITASCAAGVEKTASSRRPFTAEGDHGVTTGIELVGAPCDTSFTWKVPRGLTMFRARLELAIADSGTEAISFYADGHRRAAHRVVTSGTITHVPYSGALVTVNLAGARRFTIEMPNAGGDAGEVIITHDTFVN